MSRIFIYSLAIMMCVVSSAIVMGCNEGAPTDKQSGSKDFQESNYEITEVEGHDIMFNDTEAGALINFKSNEIDHCSLVFVKNKFVNGYNARITDLGVGDLDLTCLMADHHYAMTNNGETYVQLNIDELGEKAELRLNFSLYSIRTKMKLTRENVVLVVNNNQLKAILDQN